MKQTKIALISGSSKGIGRAIAEKVASNGYIPFITGRSESSVLETNRFLLEKGLNSETWVGDLTNPENCRNLISLAIGKYGSIDLLVTNLGGGKSISGPNPPYEEYIRMFQLNFFSAVSICSEAIPYINENGNIIMISSIAGSEYIGAPIPYSAAKAALAAYSKSLARTLANRKIRINTISPGNVFFEGGRWEEKLKEDEATVLKYLKENVPLNKFGKPEDVADGILFLINNSFITGTNLVIDGGQLKRFL